MTDSSKNNKLAIWLSMLALLLSSAGFYFQFIHVSDSVNISKIDLRVTPSEMVLNLAASNIGTTDVAFLYLGVQVLDSNYEFKSNVSIPFVLKPNEIKLIEFKSINTEGDLFPYSTKNVEEHKIQLDTRIIGGTGWDRLEHTIVGKIFEQNNRIAGQELLKFPVRL